MNIVDKIKEVINDGDLKDPYLSHFPRVFRYSDKYSIDSDSSKDIKLSYELGYIARNIGGANIGDGVLVIAKPNDESSYKIFAAVIIKNVGKMDDWQIRGGRNWKFGYKIIALSLIIKLHEVIIESIIDSKLNRSLLNGLSFKQSSFKIAKNGEALKKIFDFCVENHPNKNIGEL